MKLKKSIIIIILIILSSNLVYGLHSSQSGNVGKFVGQYLSSDGNLTGEKNAIGDYTSGEEFYIQPPRNTVYRLSRMLITVADAGVDNADDYGAITNGVTNGVSFWLETNGTRRRLDGDNKTVKTNGDYLSLMYDFNCDLASLANGLDYCIGRWTFDKSGTVIRLNGNTNDKFIVMFNDSFTALNEHYFLVQGYEEQQQIKTQKEKGFNMLSIAFAGLLLLLFLFYLSTGDMKKEHIFLRLLIVIFVFITILLLGRATLDNCYLTTQDGQIIEQCIDNGTNTYNIFFKVTTWLFGIFWGYVLLYVIYKVFNISEKISRFVDRTVKRGRGK